MPSKPFLSVVVPVYNEEMMIGETVRRVEAYFQFIEKPGEIIIVNDGSTDTTAAKLAELSAGRKTLLQVLTVSQNSGKGYASRLGVLAAKGEYVLLTDADLSTPMKEVEKLLTALEAGTDVAIGSRALRAAGCDVQQSFKRRVSSRIFNGIVQTLVLPGLFDTQCGFKLFTARAARELFSRQTVPGFSFDVEILFLARTLGLSIRESPVMWRQGSSSRVHLFRDSTRMVRDLFLIKKTHRAGREK